MYIYLYIHIYVYIHPALDSDLHTFATPWSPKLCSQLFAALRGPRAVSRQSAGRHVCWFPYLLWGSPKMVG